MEFLYTWLYTKRLTVTGCALLVIGVGQLYIYWRGKSVETILFEDPQDPSLRYRKRREGGAFGLALAGLLLIVYSVLV